MIDKRSNENTQYVIRMNLRDWFAGQALIAVLNSNGSIYSSPEAKATWAYQTADAMLIERDKP